MTRGLDDLLEVGRMADKYQVDEVKRAVEEEAVVRGKAAALQAQADSSANQLRDHLRAKAAEAKKAAGESAAGPGSTSFPFCCSEARSGVVMGLDF